MYHIVTCICGSRQFAWYPSSKSNPRAIKCGTCKKTSCMIVFEDDDEIRRAWNNMILEELRLQGTEHRKGDIPSNYPEWEV